MTGVGNREESDHEIDNLEQGLPGPSSPPSLVTLFDPLVASALGLDAPAFRFARSDRIHTLVSQVLNRIDPHSIETWEEPVTPGLSSRRLVFESRYFRAEIPVDDDGRPGELGAVLYRKHGGPKPGYVVLEDRAVLLAVSADGHDPFAGVPVRETLPETEEA